MFPRTAQKSRNLKRAISAVKKDTSRETVLGLEETNHPEQNVIDVVERVTLPGRALIVQALAVTTTTTTTTTVAITTAAGEPIKRPASAIIALASVTSVKIALSRRDVPATLVDPKTISRVIAHRRRVRPEARCMDYCFL
ncbi:hypothetical protein AX15_002737 [Amanita polypyramis BW_CC]|nr:hypothetical protein AX15_002737 [Amanita polypyramis BW_CC]